MTGPRNPSSLPRLCNGALQQGPSGVQAASREPPPWPAECRRGVPLTTSPHGVSLRPRASWGRLPAGVTTTAAGPTPWTICWTFSSRTSPSSTDTPRPRPPSHTSLPGARSPIGGRRPGGLKRATGPELAAPPSTPEVRPGPSPGTPLSPFVQGTPLRHRTLPSPPLQLCGPDTHDDRGHNCQEPAVSFCSMVSVSWGAIASCGGGCSH